MITVDKRTLKQRFADDEIASSYERFIVRDPQTGWTDQTATDRLRLLNGASVEVVVDHPECELRSGGRGTILGIGEIDPTALRVELEGNHRVVELPASELRLIAANSLI